MRLEFFPSPKPNQIGILVVPGGGYGHVSIEKEGYSPARWLNDRGFDTWALTYTTASEESNEPIHPKPQDDAMSAIQQIRAQKRVDRLGIWGWSAGGHLSAMLITDPALQLDFAVLAYPVISMEDGVTHAGSRKNLIGQDPSAELVTQMSAHERVSEATPPVFLFHTSNDGAVPVQNSLLFASQMARYQRPFSLLVLPDGPHGLGLSLEDAATSWTGELDRWLASVTSPSS